jgi:hypothetical protein
MRYGMHDVLLRSWLINGVAEHYARYIWHEGTAVSVWFPGNYRAVVRAVECHSCPPCSFDRLLVEVCGQCIYTDISIQQRDPMGVVLNILFSVTHMDFEFSVILSNCSDVPLMFKLSSSQDYYYVRTGSRSVNNTTN